MLDLLGDYLTAMAGVFSYGGRRPSQKVYPGLVSPIKIDFKGDQKKGRIEPENFCVCAPENCRLQGGAESWTYWATI